MKVPSIVGKVLYGLLFVVVVPALLFVWARSTESSVPLPALDFPTIGLTVMSCAALLMVAGTGALVTYGKGLPMNPYPPERYVTRSVYRVTSHPIYIGFSALCIGFALATNSSSGLWLVSPIVILCCVALVQGFEKHDLRKRFGQSRVKPWIHLPADENIPPTLANVISVYVLVLIPWLILYEAVLLIGIPKDAVEAYFSFETKFRVYEWTELVYASTYVFALLAPLVAKSTHDLREVAIAGLIATGLIILLFLSVPLIAPPRPFVSHGPLGKLLLWERALDTPAAAFPSFHVVWAFLAASVYAGRMPLLRIVWWGWAVLISISCITTGMHAIVDVVAGLVVFFLVMRIRAIWDAVRNLTERLANSWKEWRVGPVRIINHGAFAAAGAFVVLSIVGTLTGPEYVVSIIVVGVSIVITSAIWAQLVEGSPSLLRPYGWWGGILGALLGILIGRQLGADSWLLAAAFSIAGPWAQTIGRLRCLVQGCCHGREAPAEIGIRYTHPRTRASKVSSLAGVPIHPTALYSIVFNLVIAIIMLRLWQLNAALSMIVGMYLILSGIARFVEEAYRGEPQTAIIAGLRLYQWMAVLSVLAGIFITMIDNTPASSGPHFNWKSIVASGFFALFTWIALGVDFPNSNRRFARLA